MTRGWLTEKEPGWGQADSFVRPDLPIFWLVVAMALAGASFLQALVGPIVNLDPGAASFLVITWTLYAAPFVTLIVALDLHEPEPPAFLAAAFAWGALVAVPIAFVANTSIDSILTKRIDDSLAARWYPALSGPWTEELLKALGIAVVMSLAARQITTVLDGIVYGAFVGLGFQIAENLLATAHALRTLHPGTGESVVVHALVVRGLGLGLWSHAVWTAIVGAGAAYWVIRRRSRVGSRWWPALVLGASLATAIALHFIWNSPWWQPDTTRFGVDDMATFVAKGIPALLLVAAVTVAARRREVAWFTEFLSGRPGVTDHEIAALQTWRGRRSACRTATASGGRVARRAMRRLQAAQVRFAVAIATGRPRDEVEAASQRMQFARAVVERTTARDAPAVSRHAL